MALWNGLGQAATVAQLVGTDAVGLVSAILHAVRTARRNRKECRLLARRVMMVGDLLQLLQDSETTRRPEVRRALDGLDGALRQAYELVVSCQESSAVYGFIRAGRQAEQFRDVQGDIDSYLLVFPVVSHIDITLRLDRIYNMLLPPGSQQVSEELLGSPTSHLELDARNERIDLGFFQIESNRTITEPCESEEPQRAEGVGELLARDQRLKWLCCLPQQDVPQQDAPEHPAYDLLKAATNNFSSENEIGRGSSATVYKAKMRDGLEVAIKRFPGDERTSQHYESEIRVLTKLQHTNIIKLLGHCTGQREMILVYELMPNGSLDKFIFDLQRGVSLDWLSRFRIIEGIAQGLLYLHTYTELCIVHRDLKPYNILLDSDLNAKISDFGIAKMLSTGSYREDCIMGTYGYMAPEYAMQGILSNKVDVYAYGVILLEVIGAKRYSISCLQVDEYLGFNSFTTRAWHLWTTGRSIELIDLSLRNEARTTEITRCIQIALLCVQTDPADRPSMSDVLLMLSSGSIIPAPKLPDLYRAEDTSGEISYGYASSEATWSSSDLTWPR